ncbi:MAG TPA: hypothetical protein V6D19_14915 [Stenomitos sp.]
MSKPKLEQSSPTPLDNGSIYERGKNPASLQNLTSHKGRPKVRDTWGEDPGSLTTSCTPTAKKGLPDALKASGYTSLAELLEYLGRGLITLPQKPEPPKL